MANTVNIAPSWHAVLGNFFETPVFNALREFLHTEKRAGKIIYPPGPQIFAAFEQTPFENVKVVILGQDPYHGPGQAHGLCFSVNNGIPVPPSLRNIFQELTADIEGFVIPTSGNLTAWANQGVLLLNATLTVRQGEAGSHQKRGWEEFTDEVIRTLSAKKEHVVFMLWGAYAQSKSSLIDTRKHLILQAPHPSPLSAHRGYLGCKHFSKANQWLIQNGQTPVNWKL